MAHNQFALLQNKRFLPLFITQFLGAFHDNLFKNALVVLLIYNASAGATYDPKILTTMAMALFILPFVIFSATGGKLADKYAKDKVIRVIKVIELVIAAAGIASLYTNSVPLSFVTLFALGTHSAFFGPSKYSILPQQLEAHDLIGANALLNTGTFLAILLGTIFGTSLIMLESGPMLVGGMIGACALLGYITSRAVPPAPPTATDINVAFNPITETYAIVKHTLQQPQRIVRSILGVSWFYFVGSMFMAQFPNYAHETLKADPHVLTFFLVVFSVGIAAGGLLNNRILRGRIEATYAPFAMLGLSIFAIDLYFASNGIVHNTDGSLLTIGHFLAQPSAWRITIDIALISMFGGLFEVPLAAIVQQGTAPAQRARVQAGNAIINALFIVMSAVVSAIILAKGASVHALFLIFAAANCLAAIYICKLLPDYLLKSFLQGLFKLLYRVEIHGLENYEKAGKRAVIVGNHVSLLDPPLLAAFLPGKPMFAVASDVAQWWWVKPFLKLVDAFPLDPTNPYSMKSLIRKVEEDKHVVIFPEGRLTETGALMKVYDGPGMIADKADAVILPIRLDGVQHTGFARLKGKVASKLFPKITITILEPRKFELDPNLRGRARRASAGRKLYDLMEDMMFATTDCNHTLYEGLVAMTRTNGHDTIIAEDPERKPVSCGDLVTRASVLGCTLARHVQPKENTGLMLPNSVAAVTSFFALQSIGAVPAMLNFSSGIAAMLSACKTAQIKTVITSRRFISMGRMEPIIEALSRDVRFLYLEDLRDGLTASDKLRGKYSIGQKGHVTCNDPAVILFTSGSEGLPKGVVLSHKNLLSNIAQLVSRVDFNRQDIVFNCLPMFHSFGLTGGTLLPILSGVRTFLYPSPLHYRIVPELVYSSNASIMFGTDTFLNGYARMADPYDFFRMRYIFAGAEKVKDETRRLYMDRFGVQVLEGYGATETSPVIAVNSAMHKRTGTVGRMLAGMTHRLEPVTGIDAGGRLFVRGPNVMLGYYLADQPGILQPPSEGWHDTGDIVTIDHDGYVKIAGRAKRFAKIAGEMVSLTAVEALAEAVWPQAQSAVIAVPDTKKGEQLVLFTTQENAARDQLGSYAQTHGINALSIPATIRHIEKMPVLGSGKTDYVALKGLVA